MSNFFTEIRIALRSLVKHRGFTIVAVLTLTLGIGATTAVFSVTHGILLRPLPYKEAERIVAVWQTARDNPAPTVGGSTSHVNYLDWKRDAKSFESLALYAPPNFVLTGLGEAEIVRGGIVTPGFFRVFKADPIMGREFTREEDLPTGPNVAIISYGFWKERLGGRPDVLGTMIELSSRPTEIVGVAPAGFDFPNNARIWTPIKNDDANCGRGCVYLDGIARLKEGVAVEQAREEMRGIAARLEEAFPNANTNVTAGVALLQDDTVRNVRLALLLLLGSVAMVLLIACANVANLVMVRGRARETEMAVRAALGGSRKRLLSFLCTENLVLALLGATGGLILAWWGIGALKQLAPADIPRLDEVSFDITTFGFALGLAFVTTMLFGLGPALQLSRSPLATMLGGRGDISTRRMHRSRSVLVAAEVGLSLMLLVGAGLLLRTLSALQSVETGFNSEAVSFSRYDAPRIIVGIVEDVHSQTLVDRAAPELYVPQPQTAARSATFVIRSQVPPSQVLSSTRQIVQARDRNLPVIRPGTLEQVVDRHVARPRFYMLLLALFAILAVCLASIGTYGVVAYAVAQRTREIGLRVALGARPAQVVFAMLWQGFKPAVVGIVLGLIGSVAAGRFIAGLLFNVSTTDPMTFAAVTLVLVGLVCAASIIPARRAVRVSPAIALRTE